ncbi:hypothetical protein SAY86_013689 [Trapa natans]|uniref:Uncharacterized protein n=1 Tax=Trapa natans TaxID=22666 RepID=A0AAN7KV13_TRANT|nr:hypothetical protein SAY86_013689 [Trapa natans]
MEFKYHEFDRSPSEFFPRQAIGDDVRHAQNIGSSSATNFYLNQIPEQSHYQLAVSSDMRHAPNCISNLEVHTVTQRNNPLEDVKYDAIQWQLEKHRIRKEIISSEIERRRMLEIEVRRELEQEMAMLHAANRFTFQERSPMCFNQRVSYVDRVDSQMMLEARTVGAGTTDNVFGLRYPLQSLPGATQSGINSEDGSRIIMLVNKKILILSILFVSCS